MVFFKLKHGITPLQETEKKSIIQLGKRTKLIYVMQASKKNCHYGWSTENYQWWIPQETFFLNYETHIET